MNTKRLARSYEIEMKVGGVQGTQKMYADKTEHGLGYWLYDGGPSLNYITAAELTRLMAAAESTRRIP